MAYATKYLFKWQSANGTTREIRVLKDGYSGSVIQRHLGRAPVLKKQHNGNVYGTSLEFYAECAVDGEFAEFYTTDPKAYKVELYAGSTLLWQGYVTPELYREPDIAPPYDVQVIATDGVGELKLYNFAPQGLVTLRAMLTYLLGYTGLGTDVYLVSSIKPGGSGAAGSLLSKSINLDFMAGETCYKVLTLLLDTLHASITWWKGAWILARETNVTLSSGKVQYYNTSGNSATLTGSVVTLGKIRTNDAWPVGQLSTEVNPAKNSVTIQAPWHPTTAFVNSDMDTDTGWDKTNNASFDSTKKAYYLVGNGASTAIAGISQDISMGGIRTPMRFTGKFCATTASASVDFGNMIFLVAQYQVGSTTYHVGKDSDGNPTWLAGQANLLDFITRPSVYDTDETNAEEITFDIPAFGLLGSSYPSGTLSFIIAGTGVYVFNAYLDVVLPKGYQDNLYLDNGARGSGDSVEIVIGRETSDVNYYKAFLQGILLDSGSLITSFKDAYITDNGLDYLSFISRDYARSIALPRLTRTGTVFLESAVSFPPLVFIKGAVNYWLEGFSWDMYEDELQISAKSLPTATITVDSEVISEASGSTASFSAGTSGGGASTVITGGGSNYFEPGSTDGLIQLKSAYSYLGPRKGLIFEQTAETDVASSPAHLMLRNYGTQAEPIWALYTPLAFVSDGDQVIGDGASPGGGGGGGQNYLKDLYDVSLTNLTTGQMLQWNGSAWVNVAAPSGGGGTVTSVALTVPTGLSVSGSPITSSGTLAISFATGYSIPTTAKQGNWDTAYGWGDHAQAGYLTGINSSMVTTALGYTPVNPSNVKTLSVSVGSTSLGTYNPLGSANASWTISAQNLYDTIGSTKYHVYGGDTTLNPFKIGRATLEWVTGTGGAVSYLHIDCPIVTDGDQVIGSGASPGGGGGGSSYLKDLLDVQYGLSPSADDMLIYSSSVALNPDGTITGPGWTKISKSNVGRIYTGGTGISISSGNVISLDSSEYYSASTTRTANTVLAGPSSGSSAAASFRALVAADLPAVFSQGGTAYKLTYDKYGRVTGAAYADLSAAINGDLSTGTSNPTDNDYYVAQYAGGGTTNTTYHRRTHSALYSYIKQKLDSVYLPQSGGALKNANYMEQLTIWRDHAANDAVITYRNNTGILGVIGCAGSDGAPYYSPDSGTTTRWLLHSGNYTTYTPILNSASTHATKASVIYAPTTAGTSGYVLTSNGSGAPGWTAQSSLTAGKATADGNGNTITSTYLPLAGGTMTGAITMTDGVGVYSASGYIMLGLDSNGTTFYCGPGPASSVAFLLRSGNINLTHRKYTSGSAYTDYTIWDGGNSNSNSINWKCANLFVGYDDVYIGADSASIWWVHTSSGYPLVVDGTAVRRGASATTTTLGTSGNRWYNVYSAALDISGTSTFASGHLYLTGSAAASSTANTTQIVFGTSTTNHVAISSNSNAVIINPTTSTTTGQVMLGCNGEKTTFSSSGGVVVTNGNVAIGQSANSSYKFQVVGSSQFNISAFTEFRILRTSSGGSSAVTFLPANQTTNWWSTGADPNASDTSIAYRYFWYYKNAYMAWLTTTGSLVTTGDQVISSDATLKENLQDVTYTVNDIAKTRAVTFDWKDGRGHSAGSIAQDWKALIPELVHGEEGNMTLAYGQIALLNSILLARHETEQDKEIKKLKSKVKRLEIELARLNPNYQKLIGGM